MTFTPEHYHLRIEPDLESFSSPGVVTIAGRLEGATSLLRLDARDLSIENVEIQVDDETIPEVRYTVNSAEQALDIDLGASYSGRLTATVQFTAGISDGLAGLYRSSYRQDGAIRYMAITQFEEIDARAAFPCVDRPGAKAVFDIEFVLARELTGICNTPVVDDEALDDSRHRIRFATTPPMSTYLLFFGVGEFEFSQNESYRIPVRCATRPGQSRFGTEAMAWTIESLRFGEEYTGHLFPIDKMDLIACPDFAFGAMENYGAISFRENRVLIWPGVTPAVERERVCQITNHEVAHMWFGDLVSPKDWSYVWLNEAFATYFGYVITDTFHPEFEGLEQFIANQMHVAFHRDALRPTVPVEFPEGQELEFGPATTPIIYRKAASILRMFRLYLGDCGLEEASDGDASVEPQRAAFREGVRAYMDEYAHRSADTDGFLEAFSRGVQRIQAAPEFSTDTLAAWIRTPGYPMVSVTRTGSSLKLKRSRFTYLPETSPSQCAPVPLTLRYVDADGAITDATALMNTDELTLELAENTQAVKLNADQAGFYRVAYDADMLARLGNLCSDGLLGPRDRFGILYDLHALVVSGSIRLADYLTYLDRYFTGEHAFLPALQITRSLTELHTYAGERATVVADTGTRVLKPLFTDIGAEPQADEAHTQGILREAVLWALYSFGEPEVSAHLVRKAEILLSPADSHGAIHYDLRGLYYKVAARESETFVRNMLARVSDAAIAESEAQEITSALGLVHDARLLSELLDFTMETIPVRNRFLALVTASSNTATGNAMWDWFLTHQEAAAKLPRFHLLTALVLFARSADAARSQDVSAFFEAYAQAHADTGMETIAMALEEHALRVALCEHLAS